MTALLDTPLPQLRPAARPVRSGTLAALTRPLSHPAGPTPMRPEERATTQPPGSPPWASLSPSAPRGTTSFLPAPPAGPPQGPHQRPHRPSPGQSPPNHQEPLSRAGATAVCAPVRPSGARRQSLPVAPAMSPLRMTRRARLLVTVATSLSLLAIVVLAMVNADPTRGELRDAPASVVVQSGDTLWQIAVDVAPAEDPAVVVELLRSANDLDTAALRPGQVLTVPRG